VYWFSSIMIAPASVVPCSMQRMVDFICGLRVRHLPLAQVEMAATSVTVKRLGHGRRKPKEGCC
jgi:hypothetical protein